MRQNEVPVSASQLQPVAVQPQPVAAQPQPDAAQPQPVAAPPRRGVSPLLIVEVVVAVLIAIGAFTAVIVTQLPNQGEQAPDQSAQANQASQSSSEASEGEKPEAEAPAVSEPDPEPALPDDQRAIAALDGWWESVYHGNGYRAAFGHVHDGVIDWYNSNDMGTAVSLASTVRITRAERFSENGTEGWRFFVDSCKDDSWAYYQADGKANELPVYKIAFGYGVVDQANYNIYSVERYGMTRIVEGSEAANSSLFAQAQTLAG